MSEQTARQNLTPEHCATLGFFCVKCIADQTNQLEGIVGRPIARLYAEQLFQHLYPSPGCFPQRNFFVRIMTQSRVGTQQGQRPTRSLLVKAAKGGA